MFTQSLPQIDRFYSALCDGCPSIWTKHEIFLLPDLKMGTRHVGQQSPVGGSGTRWVRNLENTMPASKTNGGQICSTNSTTYTRNSW
jgi:hypothetical protein